MAEQTISLPRPIVNVYLFFSILVSANVEEAGFSPFHDPHVVSPS